MIAMLPYSPHTCNPDDVLAAQKQMRMVNWFCSDIQVRGEYPRYANRFFAENGISIQWNQGTRRSCGRARWTSTPSATT